MARTKIRYDQAVDTDFVEEKELLSDGTLSQSGPFSIVSVTSSTKQIVVSSGDFEDDSVGPGDILVIAGGTANDGTYTIDQVISENIISVLEAVSDAGATGTAETFYPPADERIGIQDPGVGYTHTGSYNTLDDHILDAAAHSGTDNLGNHIATQDLDMGGFAVTNTNLTDKHVVFIDSNGDFIEDSNIQFDVTTKELRLGENTRLSLQTSATIHWLFGENAAGEFALESDLNSGTLFHARTANYPQMIWGSGTSHDGAGYLDMENHRDLLVNALHRGMLVMGPGGIRPGTNLSGFNGEAAFRWEEINARIAGIDEIFMHTTMGIFDVDSLGAESITNGDFASGSTGWTAVNDLAIVGSEVIFTGTGTGGTLTQTIGNMATAPVGDTGYLLTYTLEDCTHAFSITLSGISAVAINLPTNQGTGGGQKTHSVYFRSAVSPGNFIITFSGTSSSARLDNISLKQVDKALEVDATDFTVYNGRNVNMIGGGTLDLSGPLVSEITGAAANLALDNAAATTSWEIRAGRTAFYDNWLLFKNSAEAGNYTFAVKNTGQMIGKDGSAGAPTFSFDNASNYGMSYDPGANEGLVLSTEGFARFRIEDDGTLSVAGTTNYETLVTADDDIPNKKYIDDRDLSTIGTARNSATATNEWLRTQNGTPTNLAPIRFPYPVTIIAISATCSASGTWDGELYDGAIARTGGTPSDASKLGEIQLSAQTGNQVTGLNITRTAGQELGIFMRGTTISYPKVDIWFVRTG